MQVTIIDSTFNPIGTVAQASAICYNTKIRDREHEKQIIRTRIKDGHESVLEHASFTFQITGISRACSHQIVRHRISSISQRSQRYVNEKEFGYILPPSFETNKECEGRYRDLMEQISLLYQYFVECGIKKGDARYILPNACTTELIQTFNVRSLRNFLNQRLDNHAQWEIRNVAKAMIDELIKLGCDVFIEDIVKKYESGV